MINEKAAESRIHKQVVGLSINEQAVGSRINKQAVGYRINETAVDRIKAKRTSCRIKDK